MGESNSYEEFTGSLQPSYLGSQSEPPSKDEVDANYAVTVQKQQRVSRLEQNYSDLRNRMNAGKAQ